MCGGGRQRDMEGDRTTEHEYMQISKQMKSLSFISYVAVVVQSPSIVHSYCDAVAMRTVQ